MSTPLKLYKKMENELHEHLYNNILLLTYAYPTTKDFNAILSNTMFLKTNKAAFHKIVYFLLNILNEEMTKAKITSWPLFDVKMETKFRDEVLSYINELNSIYPEAGIPNMVKSHLISPGGYKFIKFMLKLSQLVIIEHLKKGTCGNSEILPPITHQKNSQIKRVMIQTYQRKTTLIHAEVRSALEKFIEKFSHARNVALGIITEKSELNKELISVKNVRETKLKEFDRDSCASILDNLTEKVIKLNDKMDSLKEIGELARRGIELMSFLANDRLKLEFNVKEFKLPSNVSDLVKMNNSIVDLFSLYFTFDCLLKDKILNMPHYNISQLNLAHEKLGELIKNYSGIDKQLDKNIEMLRKIFDTRLALPSEE